MVIVFWRGAILQSPWVGERSARFISEHDRWDAIRDGQAVEAKGP
jgi:hypothetical protein